MFTRSTAVATDLQMSAQHLAMMCLPRDQRKKLLENSNFDIPSIICTQKSGADNLENLNRKLKQRNGLRHYAKLKARIIEKSRLRNQVALSISIPTFTREEEDILSKGKISKDRLLDSFSAKRIRDDGKSISKKL